MQEKTFTRSKKVIEALRRHYGMNIGEFAQMLGVGGSTVSTWARRDSLDEDLLFRKCQGVSYEFLATGEGPVFLQETDTYKDQVKQGLSRDSNDLTLDDIERALIKEVRKKGRGYAAKLVVQLIEEDEENICKAVKQD